MSLPAPQFPPPAPRSVGVYVIAALFLLVAVAEIFGFVMTMKILLSDPSGVNQGWLLVSMIAPMAGLLLFNLLSAIAVFKMRREALIFMGCVLGLSLQQVCTLAVFSFVMLVPTLSFLFLCILIYCSAQLARNGTLR
jgi:hypothetical protein